MEGKRRRRDASAEAVHSRRGQKDDARGDAGERVAERALAGRLWSVGGLGALMSISQLGPAPAGAKEWSGWRCNHAHGRAEDRLLFRTERSQVERSE